MSMELPIDPPDDDERCQCRELTGTARHVPECDLADNDVYDKVRDDDA